MRHTIASPRMNLVRLVLAGALAATGCAGTSAQTPPPAPVAAAQTAATPAPAAPTTAASEPLPEAPPELAFPDEPFRAEQPTAGEARPLKTPDIQRFKLSNGIEVFLVERHNLPIVSMSLVFDGGSATDPKGKEGLASHCAGLMTDGTDKLDKLAMEEALADLASSVSSGASSDEHFVAMSTLKRNLDPTLDLWADSLLRPGLRQEEFDRELKRRIAGLQQMKGTPSAVAGRLAQSVVYGPDHLFGRFSTEASLGKLTLDECRKFVTTQVKPGGARLFAVGDITKAELTEKLQARLGAWKGRARPPARPGKPAPRKGRIFFVDIPGAPQSVVQLMHLGPPLKAPDHHATSIMSSILGGSFSSRINMNIREKHGYAYGARGGFQYHKDGSTFVASASVRSDVTKESIIEILKEVRGVRDAAPTEDEVVREKNGKILALPARFATGGDTIEVFRTLIYYGLPLNYYDQYVPKLQAVQGPAVRKSAEKHLKPEALQILVVGDGKTVLPKLKELASGGGLGGKGPVDIVQLDVDGKPLKG